MILFVNDKGEVKDVNTTTDTSLTEVEINDTEDNPLKDWTDIKLCCYKVQVMDGKVIGYSPYIDTKLIELFDKLARR